MHRALVGPQELLVRVQARDQGRVRNPGWVLKAAKGLTEVRFGDREKAVDLIAIRGEGAEASVLKVWTPRPSAFRAPSRRSTATHHSPRLRTMGPTFIGEEPLLMTKAPDSQAAPGGPVSNATVVLESTKPGVAAYRSVWLVGEEGWLERRRQLLCALPCRLQLDPGKYRIQLDAPRRQALNTELDLRPGENEVLVELGYAGLKSTGIAAVTVGAVAAIIGFLGNKPTRSRPSQPIADGLLAGGVGGLALGAVLILLGRTTVEVRSPPEQASVPSGRVVGLGYAGEF
jgi:hypothetical protein